MIKRAVYIILSLLLVFNVNSIPLGSDCTNFLQDTSFGIGGVLRGDSQGFGSFNLPYYISYYY